MSSEAWAFVCVTGFWGWVLCSLGFILKAFPARNVFCGKRAAAWGVGVVLFYCLWITAMLNA